MTAVVVLGGHRYGTSSIAGTIAALGIPASLPGEAIPASHSNPRGHFEDAVVCRFHERMLRPGGWRNPLPIEPIPRQLERAYEEHIQRRAAHAERFCIKDPRLCFLLPILVRSLRRLQIAMQVVAVSRDPVASAASLSRRHSMRLEQALRIAWLYEGSRRTQIAWVHSHAGVPLLMLDYERALQSPGGTVEQLAEFLGVAPTRAAIGFLDPALRHF